MTTEMESNLMANSIPMQQLISAHTELQKHITTLGSNAELINSHCYLIDDYTKTGKENIEKECDGIRKAIEIRKNKLIKELCKMQQLKTTNAQNIFLSVAEDLKLCESINFEIENLIKRQIHPPPTQEYINQLCCKIDEVCSKQTYDNSNDATSQQTAAIKSNFYRTSKLLKMIKKFGVFVKNNSSLNKKMNEDVSPKSEDKENINVQNNA
eukprot:UN05800